MKLIDLTGLRFGKLTVTGRGENSKDGHVRWNCKCDCGELKELPVSAQDLKTGKVISCGCYHKEKITDHGHSKERIYYTWYDMIRRCENKNRYHFSEYGERGITVCSEWHDFMKFREWAYANGYKDDLTIDRIDNNKGYSPDNCRFIGELEQANNRRSNVRITIDDETKTIAEWARESGLPPLYNQNAISKRKKTRRIIVKTSFEAEGKV